MAENVKARWQGIEKDLKAVAAVRYGRKKDVPSAWKKWTYIVPPVGKDVLRIRKNLSMSQSEFARFLFMSPSTVRSWEQGTRCPDGASAVLLRLLESGKGKQVKLAVEALHA